MNGLGMCYQCQGDIERPAVRIGDLWFCSLAHALRFDAEGLLTAKFGMRVL